MTGSTGIAVTALVRSFASGRQRRPRALLAPLAALTVALGAGWAVAALAGRGPLAGFGAEPRTIELVARKMAFVLPGAEESNPRLVVARGERVRFVLRNDDPGMIHDLSIPSLGEKTPALREAGTAAELTLRLPATPGEHAYLCSYHAVLMRGVIEVR